MLYHQVFRTHNTTIVIGYMRLKNFGIIQQRQNREFGDTLKINLESYPLLNQLISLSSPVLSLLNGRDTITFQAIPSVPQGDVGN